MAGNFSLQWSSFHMGKFALLWLISGLLTLIVPLIIMGGARASLRRQQNNGDDNDNGDNDNNDNNDNNYYNNGCRWYQWWGCNNNNNNNGDDNNNNDNNDNNDERSTPWWWFFASEEQQRDREEEGAASPAVKFAYVWSMLLFLGILFLGVRELQNGGGNVSRLITALVVYANFCFVTMVLLGGLEGGVQTEGREMEEQGFYAQFAVMVFLTNLFCLVYSVVYAVVLHFRAKRHNNNSSNKSDADESDYQFHYPEVRVTSKETV